MGTLSSICDVQTGSDESLPEPERLEFTGGGRLAHRLRLHNAVNRAETLLQLRSSLEQCGSYLDVHRPFYATVEYGLVPSATSKVSRSLPKWFMDLRSTTGHENDSSYISYSPMLTLPNPCSSALVHLS